MIQIHALNQHTAWPLITARVICHYSVSLPQQRILQNLFVEILSHVLHWDRRQRQDRRDRKNPKDLVFESVVFVTQAQQGDSASDSGLRRLPSHFFSPPGSS